MLSGEIRNQVDSIWLAFAVGGISSPLEVIERSLICFSCDGSTICIRSKRTSKRGLIRLSRDASFQQAKTQRNALTTTCAGNASSTSPRLRCIHAPNPKDVICDPACGTCGFLIASGEYWREHYPEALRDSKQKKHFHQHAFHGFDFANTMLRIGSMNMLLH